MALSLSSLAPLRRNGTPRGITSVCSAHPIVLRSAFRHGRDHGCTVLIEATCNQVNHQGGYTGMTPGDFAAMARTLAQGESCPADLILLGGDHLGPNPWRHLPADEAMAEAERMVTAYVGAGFRKLHLDASMGCSGEPLALDDETTARRAVRLAAVAETEARKVGGPLPHYVIGTEVPPPGGADHALTSITPTSLEAARTTIDVHRAIFAAAGLEHAFERVIGLVVQPGVEFGNHNVIAYDRRKTVGLSSLLDAEPRFVFEAHSTDYQGTGSLSALVEDGFSILKVGPELTFVLREAIYALDLIASDLDPRYGERPLFRVMEAIMADRPEHWQRHYSGDAATLRSLRHYSLSDRIRYYWPQPAARDAVDRLIGALSGATVPLPLFWQHMPAAARFADRPLDPVEVLLWRVGESLSAYHAACRLDG